MYKILAINPGSTSTKIALFEDETPVFTESIKHPVEELSKFESTWEQYPFRAKTIKEVLRKRSVDLKTLSAVVGRGGPFKPLESGTYYVNEKMKEDVKEGRVQADHISNIGCLLAADIAEPLGIPAFIVDPVSVDEFDDLARISGHPEIPRKSLAHALNIKMVAKKYAKQIGDKYENLNLVIAHLGGGISITAHRKGRMVDVNNANDEGPFSPQRCGTLPITGLAKLCYSGKYTEKEMMQQLIKRGGLTALAGTDDMEEIKRRIDSGDEKAELYARAMAYQIAKEIGAYSAVLAGKVDAILITGGIAHNNWFIDWIKERIEWIAPIFVFPGEDEMEALALGALRVLRGEEQPKEYK